MTYLRFVASLCLFVVLALLLRLDEIGWLVAGVLVGFLLFVVVFGGLRRTLASLWPVTLFAAVLVVMQWISGSGLTTLPLKTILVFLFATAAFRILPWVSWLFRFKPGSFPYLAVLFVLFVKHFAGILVAESRRLLTARALCISNNYGRGSVRSLAFAMVALFARSISRAERFYAAQWLRGLAE